MRYNTHMPTSPLMVPTIIVIFGITGDLARRKLIPALLNLEQKNFLPDRTKIIGFSRRTFTDDVFKDFVRTALSESGHSCSEDVLDRFCTRLSYCSGTFDDAGAYGRLGDHIYHIEKEIFGMCTNKLYYLATPPDFYETIFRQLADSGLTIPCSDDDGWARVLVEKPFGRDVKTATELDALLGTLFKEEQIFRIDHYLAKETIQNILVFRFANLLFEPVWNRKYIERIEIRLMEKRGVDGRGTFFEGVGALRDVGQNHLLQMLAVVAMEQPEELNAAYIRAERARALQKLRIFNKEKTIFGQYSGYQGEEGVAEDSRVETYFRLEAEINNKRWRNVPFVLESGKALAEDRAEIVIHFRRPDSCIEKKHEETCNHANELTFRIQPDEGISLRFWITKPGLTNELESKELSFAYAASPDAVQLLDAYERLLYDALTGDQTLFASTDEVRAAWKFVAPILRARKNDAIPLRVYEKGDTVDIT